jgi:serine/threonine protein kinase/tetratricopeptide (TPR) repeat protein
MGSNAHPNYELFEELGSGNASTVVRAFDRRLERFVAIRIPSDAAGTDPARRQRFFQEARFLANLAHPNVLPVYALEESHGWLVMELMAASMNDRLSSGPLPVEIAKSVLKQTLEALKYIHGLGRFHASIRPSNILISDTGMVKLSDFSDRRPEDGLEAPAPSLCKYVPPEVWNQSNFGPIDNTIDFYALGITIVECLAGKPLEQLAIGFNRQNSPETEWARWHTSPEHERAISELLKGLPKSLQPILSAMLKQKASERPKSADELLGLLGSTKLVAVDIPLEVEQPKVQSESPPKPKSPFPASQTAVDQSRFDNGKSNPSISQVLSRINLNDQKTFRIVAGITLTLAALLGLALKALLAGGESETPIGVTAESPKQLVEPEIAVAVELHPEDANLLVEGEEPKWTTNGKNDGTDRRAISLRPGNYNFSVQKDGFVTATSQQTVTPSTTRLTFDPLLIEVIVAADPSDATITLSDASPVEGKKNTFAAMPGKHSLSVSRSGFQPSTQIIEVTAEARSFDVSIKPFVARSLPAQEKAHRHWLYAHPITRYNPRGSIADLDEAIRLDPQLAVAFRDRAFAKAELNDLVNAESDIVRALQGLPSDYAALKVGGIIAAKSFEATKDTAKLNLAFERLNAAIKDHPNYPSARFVRSQLLFMTGRKEEARGDLDDLLQLPLELPQVSVVKSMLGAIHIESGELNSGITLFKESIEAANESGMSTTQALYRRAVALFTRAEMVEEKNQQDAQRHYALSRDAFVEVLARKDLKLELQCLERLASAQVALKDYKAALTTYTRLIDQGAINATHLRNRANCYEALGDQEAAENDRQRASRLNDSTIRER